jgi:hypothetical protein
MMSIFKNDKMLIKRAFVTLFTKNCELILVPNNQFNDRSFVALPDVLR